MADESTLSRCMRMLVEMYPKEPMTENRLELYRRLLADVPNDALEAATLQSIASCRFFPTVAELREAAFSLTPVIRGLPSAYEAWKEVSDAFLSVGHVGRPKFSHPLIGKAVEGAGGWVNMCLSTNGAAERARFIQAYETLAKREMTEVKMLPQVKRVRDALTAPTAWLEDRDDGRQRN